MTIRGLLAEIKADLHKYDDSGAIDTSSVYRWAEIALKRFGCKFHSFSTVKPY